MTSGPLVSELVVDFVRARQGQLELESFPGKQVLEPRARTAQHLLMDPSDQRAVVSLVQLGEPVFPGIGAEESAFLFPVGAKPGERHVARIGEAPIGELLRLLEREHEAFHHPGMPRDDFRRNSGHVHDRKDPRAPVVSRLDLPLVRKKPRDARAKKTRQRGEAPAPAVLLHHVGAAVELVDVAGLAARDLVVDVARAGIARDRELDALGLDRAFLERAHDLVVADHHRELQLSRHGYSGLMPTALTIFAVYSISLRIVARSSSAVLVATGQPMSSAFARTSCHFSLLTISSCSRTTMVRGIPAGPK